MPVEWALSIVVSIFNWNGDNRNCSCCRAVKLLRHLMKVLEGVLQKRLQRIATVNLMQFGFMPAGETFYAVFILRRLQEEYHAKGN